ncbi:transposase [Alkaliphilus metalliredigens]|uniref:transposase n=1 Tax=Alkaliphilus metalliredigens TaxID=208226 RepID=UPI001F60A65C|nr:transposase [Alkaliphilus metalliredigens]
MFEDDEDREKLLQTLIRYKEKCEYSIYAYCLMDNHIHLLLKEGKEPLEQIMRWISGSYVYWYNKKYERIGNLFQDRFKSEPVETESYFLTVIRYIHQNPIKAGMIRNIKDYRWSSYREYSVTPKIIDKEYVLKIFAKDNDIAIELFVKFNKENNSDECLEIEGKKKNISDDELRRIIKNEFKVEAWTLQNESKEKKEMMLKKALEIEGISTRQLARVTGVSANIIWKL